MHKFWLFFNQMLVNQKTTFSYCLFNKRKKLVNYAGHTNVFGESRLGKFASKSCEGILNTQVYFVELFLGMTTKKLGK